MATHDLAARRREFQEDGVTVLRGALDSDGLALAQAAFDWSIAHPGPAASRPFEGIDGAFYQDLCNPAAPRADAYDRALRATPIAELVTALWGDPQIWFMYEQVFLKEGGENRRTPWHRDDAFSELTATAV